MKPIVAVGVDRGGSWIRVIGLDAKGEPVRSLRKASPTLEALPKFLKSVLRQWKIKPTSLAVASRGVWTSAKRRELTQSLHSLAPQVLVMSDVEAAWWAAFGTVPAHGGAPARMGILLIAGTGSIAMARHRSGRILRAGGLGPETGDEGSAYWIANQWKKSTTPFNPKKVRAIAARAPIVLRQANRGNRDAKKIVSDAQMHLSALVLELAKQIDLHGPIPVAVSGSVLEHPQFRREFEVTLKTYLAPRTFRMVSLTTDPATASARSIMRMYG